MASKDRCDGGILIPKQNCCSCFTLQGRRMSYAVLLTYWHSINTINKCILHCLVIARRVTSHWTTINNKCSKHKSSTNKINTRKLLSINTNHIAEDIQILPILFEAKKGATSFLTKPCETLIKNWKSILMSWIVCVMNWACSHDWSSWNCRLNEASLSTPMKLSL